MRRSMAAAMIALAAMSMASLAQAAGCPITHKEGISQGATIYEAAAGGGAGLQWRHPLLL